MKAAIIGFGERGSLYADIIKRFNGELTAVCDKDPLRLDKALKEYNISSNLLFSNEADFFC
jgi:predicted dehydrogenase